MKYSVEELVKTFDVHSKEVEKMHQEAVKVFKKEHQDMPLPPHLNDHFSLPEALQCICQEIISLKNKSSE